MASEKKKLYVTIHGLFLYRYSRSIAIFVRHLSINLESRKSPEIPISKFTIWEINKFYQTDKFHHKQSRFYVFIQIDRQTDIGIKLLAFCVGPPTFTASICTAKWKTEKIVTVTLQTFQIPILNYHHTFTYKTTSCMKHNDYFIQKPFKKPYRPAPSTCPLLALHEP